MKAQSKFFASAGFMAKFALLNFLKVNLKKKKKKLFTYPRHISQILQV